MAIVKDYGYCEIQWPQYINSHYLGRFSRVSEFTWTLGFVWHVTNTLVFPFLWDIFMIDCGCAQERPISSYFFNLIFSGMALQFRV